MTHNRFSDFCCVSTFILVVHTEFIKTVRTEYSTFKSLSKMSQEQFPIKNKSREKRQKRKVVMKPCLKRRKEFYETLLVELRLEDQYNYKNYLRMTSENFEEIFQLAKDDITENTKMREPIPLRL